MGTTIPIRANLLSSILNNPLQITRPLKSNIANRGQIKKLLAIREQAGRALPFAHTLVRARRYLDNGCQPVVAKAHGLSSQIDTRW
jgi:hypothetical protein